jgi:hypothetical protein
MKIAFSIDISGSPEIVFPWIDDPDKALLWQTGVKKAEIIVETPERVGTTFYEEMEEGGNTLEMNGIITGYVPNQSISFHLESRIHRLDVIYSVAGDKNKSTVLVETNIHWKFPMNVMSFFIGNKIREGILHQTEAEFLELKRLCEDK